MHPPARNPIGMRRVVLLLSPLLLSAPFCAAQESATQGYTVHGVVVNSLSNQPIARAEVVLDQDFAVLTDGEGRFSIDEVTAGQHSVSVQRPGYLGFGIAGGAPFRIRFPGRLRSPRRIQVGPDMPDLTIRLTPTGAIRGQISLSSNETAEGLHVSILGRALQNGRMRWSLVGNTMTNSEGIFHLGSLPTGDYMVLVGSSLDRLGQPANESILGYPPEYYPGVADAGSAGVLTVAAGQTVEADFAMTRQPFYPVTAVVRAGDAVRAGGFQILDSAGRQANLPVRYDARQQLAHASVPSGRWTLQANSYGRSQSFGKTDFQVTGGPVSLAITVLPVPRLQVVIRHEFTSHENQPVAYVGPAGRMGGELGAGVNLQLVSTQATPMGGMMGLEMDSNPDPAATEWDGTMQATPGQYWVQAQAWDGYVRSITSGGVDLMSNPLTLSPDHSNAPIEVVMRNDSGTITGQVATQAVGSTTTGQSATGGEISEVHVYAIPLFATAAQMQSAMPQATGQFQMQNLAPGSYRVVACDSEQEIDFHSPEGLAPWAGKGQVVTLEPDGAATVQLDVVHMEAQQ